MTKLDDDKLLSVIRRLRDVLLSRGYESMYHVPSRPRLMALPYEPVNLANFFLKRRNVFNFTAMPWLYSALCSVSGRHDAFLLYKLFQMCLPVSAARIERILGKELLEDCRRETIVEDHGDMLLGTLRATPVGHNLVVFSNMNNPNLKQKSPAHGVYIGRDSFLLMEYLRKNIEKKRFRRSLDMCCGSGIQTFVGARQSEQAVGTDINPNSVRWAFLNSMANDAKNVTFAVSDRFAAVTGKFDLFTVNFPYDYGQSYGIRIVMDVLSELESYMEIGGEFYGTTLSWIDRENKDVLIEAIKDKMCSMPFDLELTETNYTLNYLGYDSGSDVAHIRKMGIKKGIQYLIYAKHRESGNLSLNVRRLGPAKAFFWNAYVLALRLRSGLGSSNRH